MLLSNSSSDSGFSTSTGSTSASSASLWNLTRGSWPSQQALNSNISDEKSSSYLDLMMRKCTLDDVMQEFRMNGSDSPYNPDEDKIWKPVAELSGMGPASSYLRQKSWPAPERSPAPRLPHARQRPRSMHDAAAYETEIHHEAPMFDDGWSPGPLPAATPEQSRVVSALPDRVLYSLLHALHVDRRNKVPQECRFCKNNRERETFYRSHVLKDSAGRVACPILRAFVCKRCGASGDRAHTIKYCPLSSNEERIQSAAILRSVRMASGRRRHSMAPLVTNNEYMAVDEAVPSGVQDNYVFNNNYGETPLDPVWAALEQKLLH